MKKIASIIDQIDHCKTLILRNETVALRMAFILLDNAAETLMYRKVLDEFGHNELYERILEKAKTLPPDIFDKFRREHPIPEILEAKEKWKILQYFDQKVTYLCDTCALIQKPLATVLSSLHRYRNEIYHREIIRVEILHAVAILYFETVCDLIEQLKQGATEYYSGDDWRPFFQRYNIPKDGYPMLNDDDIQIILTGFRTCLAISLNELRNTLDAYLTNRFNDTSKKLDFITKSIGLDSDGTALKLVQFSKSVGTREYSTSDILIHSPEFKRFRPPITETSFDSWKQKVLAFVNIMNKMDLLNAFKFVEDEFEPIEKMVLDFHNDLDAAIQFAVDLARGK